MNNKSLKWFILKLPIIFFFSFFINFLEKTDWGYSSLFHFHCEVLHPFSIFYFFSCISLLPVMAFFFVFCVLSFFFSFFRKTVFLKPPAMRALSCSAELVAVVHNYVFFFFFFFQNLFLILFSVCLNFKLFFFV